MQLKQKPRKTVPYDALGIIAMTAGNEKFITKVNVHGQIKEWVGVGWVDSDFDNDFEDIPVAV